MKLKTFSIIMILVLATYLFSGCNSSEQGSIASSYLKACYDKDAKKMLSLVPNTIIKDLMSEYECSKDQLTKAVEAELSVQSSSYWDCSEIKQVNQLEDVDENSYSQYFDRRG